MSVPTTRLRLRKPELNDPFTRADFITNWDTIDAYSGLYPCTSTTRPTWDTFQTGLLIHESDTGNVLRWTGTAFAPINVFPKIARFQSTPNVIINSAQSYEVSLGNFTPPRATKMLVMGTCKVGIRSNTFQNCLGSIRMDGASISVTDSAGAAGTDELCRWATIPTGAALDDVNDRRVVPMTGFSSLVSLAAHSMSFFFTAGTGAPSISLYSVGITCLFVD